jgi:hypothetical protein
LVRRLDGSRTGLNALEKWKIFLLPVNRTPAVQPIAEVKNGAIPPLPYMS